MMKPKKLLWALVLLAMSVSTAQAAASLAKGGLMYEASIGGQKFNYTPLGD